MLSSWSTRAAARAVDWLRSRTCAMNSVVQRLRVLRKCQNTAVVHGVFLDGKWADRQGSTAVQSVFSTCPPTSGMRDSAPQLRLRLQNTQAITSAGEEF